ncbi:MAG: hypothetical protein ACRCS3_06140, partial [Paracoccaceae bacterium]
GTWHVGLEALKNGPDGALGGVAFPWDALPITPMPLERGQVSVIRPGYPQPWEGEDGAAFAFRQKRDAAHLDGLLPVGAARQRMVKEPHAWILGIALNDHDADASPLTVWEGSHLVLGEALRGALADIPKADWGNVDLTAAYQAARRRVFDTCPRVTVPLRLGEASLLHRLTLHGMAPWADGAVAPDFGRMIAYFRPMLPSVAAWLDQSFDQSRIIHLAERKG